MKKFILPIILASLPMTVFATAINEDNFTEKVAHVQKLELHPSCRGECAVENTISFLTQTKNTLGYNDDELAYLFDQIMEKETVLRAQTKNQAVINSLDKAKKTLEALYGVQ